MKLFAYLTYLAVKNFKSLFVIFKSKATLIKKKKECNLYLQDIQLDKVNKLIIELKISFNKINVFTKGRPCRP